MNTIKIFVEQLLTGVGLSGSVVPVVRHIILVLIAIALAVVAEWVCRRFIPLVQKLTQKTEARWDDVMFNERVLRSASQIVPAIVIWQLLPSVFFEYPVARELLARLTAIYITVMSVRTSIVFIDSLKLLEGEKRTARQQYLYTVCGVLKILMIFVAAIIVIAITVNKNPATLFAGLGAASAILMLAFQDTIKGLVAGVRLTSNDMLHKGDRITVPSAGADGIVEEITLTTVKVRNFDNTIITVTPQTLVDGSFQNWIGMEQGVGRKVARKIFFDYRSIVLEGSELSKNAERSESSERSVNLTRYRYAMEQWLSTHRAVVAEQTILVHQLDGTPNGLPVEFVFWLKEKSGVPYEHAISDIMEHIYAEAQAYGLRIYQQFPEQ